MSRFPKPLAPLHACLFFTALCAGAAVSASETVGCAKASALPLDATVRLQGAPRPGADLFRLVLTQPGALTLHVSTPASGPSWPRLSLLGGSCRPHAEPSHGFEVIRRTPLDAVVLVREPGEYYLAVAAEDPERPLPAYKLRNTFVSDDTLAHSLGTKDCDEADVNVLENPLTVPGVFCEGGEVDDHGDTLLCATSLGLGHVTGGVVENAFGDDEDHFTFVVDRLETVAIDVRGVGTRAILYDGAGHRLEQAEGVRIVRSLGAGRYYVRVTSRAEGTGYVIAAEPLR